MGVAALRVMPHDAHDVALLPSLVAGILHRLAIHRQGIVVDTPGLIPGIEGLIQGLRSKAYQAIANDKFANDVRGHSKGYQYLCVRDSAQSYDFAHPS